MADFIMEPVREITEKESYKLDHKKTLRDELAIVALNGILAGRQFPLDRDVQEELCNEVAELSYMFSDAMMKVRNKI